MVGEVIIGAPVGVWQLFHKLHYEGVCQPKLTIHILIVWHVRKR